MSNSTSFIMPFQARNTLRMLSNIDQATGAKGAQSLIVQAEGLLDFKALQHICDQVITNQHLLFYPTRRKEKMISIAATITELIGIILTATKKGVPVGITFCVVSGLVLGSVGFNYLYTRGIFNTPLEEFTDVVVAGEAYPTMTRTLRDWHCRHLTSSGALTRLLLKSAPSRSAAVTSGSVDVPYPYQYPPVCRVLSKMDTQLGLTGDLRLTARAARPMRSQGLKDLSAEVVRNIPALSKYYNKRFGVVGCILVAVVIYGIAVIGSKADPSSGVGISGIICLVGGILGLGILGAYWQSTARSGYGEVYVDQFHEVAVGVEDDTESVLPASQWFASFRDARGIAAKNSDDMLAGQYKYYKPPTLPAPASAPMPEAKGLG